MNDRQRFDRRVEDVGNIQNMEHFNLTVPDQQLASLFYVTGIGLTRDPYMDFGTFNMWVNAGEQQFHLPKRDAQCFRGTIGVVVPNLEDLKRRLDFIARPMEGTKFEWQEHDDHIDVHCPWGNHIRIHAAEEDSSMSLGIPYGDMNVPTNTADAIANFYRQALLTPAEALHDNEGSRAVVAMGYNQKFIFRETDETIPEYDRHHIAIYVSNFSHPHRFMSERELISEESDQHQYRFEKIIDPGIRKCADRNRA